jgi:hypothetical protein
MAGKQSQANKNFWYAYALWQQKVAQALARRRAEELARKRAEAGARARQAQQPSTPPKSSSPLAKLVKMGLFIIALGGVGLAGGSVIQNGAEGSSNHKISIEGVSGGGNGNIESVNDIEQSCGLLYPSDTMDTIRCSVGAALKLTANYVAYQFSNYIVENFDHIWCWAFAIDCPWYDLGIESYANSNTLPHTQVQPFPQIQTQPSTHPLENDDTDVRPTDGVVNPDRPDDDQYIILYHYTPESRVNIITTEGLLPSIQPLGGGGDAKYGNGQYFTDLTPEEASTVTRGQLAYSLFEDFRRWGYRTPIAWMKFQFRIEDVRLVDELHGSRFPHRSIYLRGGTDTLSMSGILLDTGLVTFLIND